MRGHRIFVAVLAAVFLTSIQTASGARQPDGQYRKGYAEAMLHHVLDLPQTRVSIVGSTVTVIGKLDRADERKVDAALGKIKWIRHVLFAPQMPKKKYPGKKKKWTKRLLYSPPIADPRAPRFSASWQNYLGNNSLTNVGSVSFGETLTLADFTGDDINRRDVRLGNFDLNFQGAVFSIFDMDGTSKDLVNSDFWAAIAGSYRQRFDTGDASGMLRLFHQSSHLGDEYILFNAITDRDRVNVSYEGLDLTAAWQPNALEGLRLYTGGGMLLRREPTTLDRWSAKAGAELEWPTSYGRMYPVAAAHFQAFGENDWQTDVSLAAGVQFRDPRTDDRQVRLMLSYFNGYSPNGQFYDEQLEYVGFGGQYQF